MRGALVVAKPPRLMATTTSSTGASRTALHEGNRAVRAANVRAVFTSAVFCESTV